MADQEGVPAVAMRYGGTASQSDSLLAGDHDEGEKRHRHQHFQQGEAGAAGHFASPRRMRRLVRVTLWPPLMESQDTSALISTMPAMVWPVALAAFRRQQVASRQEKPAGVLPSTASFDGSGMVRPASVRSCSASNTASSVRDARSAARLPSEIRGIMAPSAMPRMASATSTSIRLKPLGWRFLGREVDSVTDFDPPAQPVRSYAGLLPLAA